VFASSLPPALPLTGGFEQESDVKMQELQLVQAAAVYAKHVCAGCKVLQVCVCVCRCV